MSKVHSTKKSTKEEFIQKAMRIHSDKYDYSEVVYENNRTPVKIWCKKHQEFFMQKPNVHLNGAGCKKCGYEKNSNTRAMKLDEFIKRSIEKYGKDKFDFSFVTLKNIDTKVKIICNIHGEFETTPHTFLSPRTIHGCYQCSREAIYTLQQTQHKYANGSIIPIGVSSTTEQFIEKAKNKFGDIFDYSKVDYVRSDSKVTIICPTHGEFQQTPASHLSSTFGCPSCGYANLGLAKRIDIEEFIKKANKLHNFKYNYSKVEYTTSGNPVTIICPIHGEFQQTPSCHTSSGQGCPKCGNERTGDFLRKTVNEFIEKANEVHNFKYDYSKVVYQGNKIKVEIICPTHGSFWQKPNDHTCGHGCRYCSYDQYNMSYSDRYFNTPTTFYNIKYKGVYKIGITTKDVYERYSQEVDDINAIEILNTKQFQSAIPALKLEKKLLDTYQEYRYKGERLLKKTGITEMFEIDVYKKYLEDLKNGE